MPFRPNPLTPFPAREGGKFGWVLLAGGEVKPKTLATPQLTGVEKRGAQGAQSPMAGSRGGVPFMPTEVSFFEKGRPSPTFIKRGVQGA
jgi:hypothetical protein